MSGQFCRICGTKYNLEYCSRCGKYFCPTCKKRYPDRFAAMVEDRVVDPIGDLLAGLGKLFSGH